MVPMAFRDSILQHLETTSHSADASTPMRRAAHLDLAFALLSNFTGKADPPRAMKHLRDGAAMGSSMALAMYCRLHNVFDVESSPSVMELAPPLSDLRIELLALPEDSPLSTWLRVLEAWNQRQAMQTKMRVTLGDRVLVYGGSMEAIEMCLENSGPLDVEALKATVVDSIDAEMNPCFESPLLLDIACRLGNLDLVQQLLTMHLPQDRQERSRHLVGDCLVQACRGGKIHVVEHLVRHVAEPYLMWPKSSTGLHWLFMFQPEDQQKALDLLTNTSHYWHTSLLTRAPEPGVHVGLATLTGSPIEFATAVRATSTVDVLVAKITELQGKGLLGQVTQDQFRQAITRHVASAVGVLLPLELRRRRGHNVESALARLRLSQGKTEFQPFGIFDVGRSASSLSLALLHGSAEAMSRAIDDTIDVILTSRIADINDADDDTLSETPLVEAVRWAPCSYDTAILSSLISRGAHLGDTPAPVVLKRLIAPRPAGTKRVVTQILVEAGLLEIDAVLIIQAIETADAEIVGALLDYCPGSFSLSQPLKRYGHATSITLLQAAVLFPGGADLVLFLIDKGADIDEAGEGTSPLEISMMKPSDADVIDLLIERGASLKATNYPTVIHLAASLDVFVNGSHVLSHLLRHERVRARLADEQAQTNENILSPIHAACFSANVEAIAAMLEVGVELPRGDGELDILAQSILLGRRPKLNQLLHVSEEDDDAVFRWKTKSERLILYLLDRLESNHGRTPLHVACQIGNLRRVQALVEEDFASLFATDSHGRLPIDFLEDPNLLEEQRFQREDISERTVSNAQRLWDYIEMKVAEKLSSAAADLMAQDLDGATLNNFSLSPRQTPVSCALNRDSSASAGSAELTTDSQFGLKPERMGHGDISKALAEVSAESYGSGRAVSCRNGSSTDFLDGNKAPEEVLPIVRDLFERKSQQLGELHQETLDVNETLLELLGILNQQEEASEMVAPLLRRRRAVHQQDDARIFGVWRDSLIVLLNEGRELEAEEELRKAMEAAKNLVGVSHVSYLMFVPVLATIECSRGNHSECLSTNERLLETLETVEQQTQRGTSLRSEILVHLCYHRLGEGNTDAVRKHMNAALKCLTSIEPRHFLVEFDVLRSLATTIEQVDVVLSHMMWTELLSICGSRCEPGGYCVIESRRHLAKNLMNRGMFEDAYDQYHRVTQATVICKGHDVEEALLASIDEARALHKRNLNPAALSLLRPVLEKFERRQGGHEEDLHTLEAKALLAQLLLAQDNLDDWEVVAREVAGGYAQRQPSSDVAVDSKRTLAETLSRMGRSSEASQIAQECLEITTEVHQECHPRTMAIATEAQLYLARCAQWVASVSMCERGLAIAKALHGESSQEVADWLHLLGTSMGLADMDGGLELLLQSIDLTVQLDGGTHSRSSLTSMWSAGVHMRKQSPEKALKMFCEILESCNSLEDEPQSLKIRVRTDIGRCYTDLEQYADALPHLEQSVRESRQLWGDSTKETISVIDSLIDVLLPLGRAKEALPLAHEVLDFFESTSASSEDELIEAKGRLADVYYNLDKCSSAERLWEQALKGLAELGDEADQDKVADYRHNRARALVGILDFEAAADLSYLSFDHYRHAKGNEAKETLLVSITRAYIDSLLGKHAAAETTLLGVIESSKRSQALDYLVGQAEAKLGGLYIKMGKHQNAEEVLLRAVQRVERDFTAHHFLYRAYKEQLKYEEAEEQAAVLLSMVSEDVDEEAIDAELQLFQLYVAMDDLDKAQIWANSLFGRLKNLTDYQGNPLDVALGLQDLIEFFERTKDEQRLFEASVVVSLKHTLVA